MTGTPKPPPVVNTYQPQYQNEAGANLFQGISALQPAAQSYAQYAMPQIQQAAQGVVNNPYAAPMQQGVNQAAQYASSTLTPQLQQGASSLFNLGGQAAAFAPQALSAGFDPQNALYDRTQQQIRDQSNATNAMYGLSASPYGGGLANQALSNFNIDWQNNQLQRQATGANTAAQLTNTANAGFQGGQNIGTGAFQTGAQAAQLPYTSYANNLLQNISALGAGGQAGSAAQGPAQQIIANLSNYLGLGQNAAANQNQALQTRYQNQLAGLQQSMGGLGGLGSFLGGGFDAMGGFPGIGSMFGSSGGAGGLGSILDDAGMAIWAA